MDKETYAFGDFRVDVPARQLLQDGLVVPIQPKPFELLVLLLRQAGRAVSHDEIRQCIWPDVVVTEASLRQTLFKLREIVGVGRIQTLPRHGLRWSEPQDALAEAVRELPAERDAFVGREDALAALKSALSGPDRLVTLVGPGGVGKTRLALHHAHTRHEPVYFCDLCEARDEAQMLQKLCAALQVPQLGADPEQQLLDKLRQEPCLVILDNFEQLVAHASSLGRWLDRTERARFLVTSRAVLGLPGERVLSLQPLEGDEALELFVVRARSARQDFALDAAGREAATALVRLLDGLPLAIELVAVRVRALGVPALLQRLQGQLALQAASDQRPGRQRTLRATLDWSWQLLDAPARSALAQLSVFEGGFTLEAAEAVLELPETSWAADVLEALVDQSMVQASGPDRYSLLSTVQIYASARLDELEQRTFAEQRHGSFFAALPRALAPLELANLVAACRRAVGRGDGATALAALGGVVVVVGRTGPLALAVELATAVVGIQQLSPRERGSALHFLGNALRDAGRSEESRAPLHTARALYKELGERGPEGRVMLALAISLLKLGQLAEAVALKEETLLVMREVGDRLGEAMALNNLAVACHKQHKIDQACSYYEQSLLIYRDLGHSDSARVTLRNLGILRMAQGRLDEAQVHLESMLRLEREGGNREAEGVALSSLGTLALHRGQLQIAQEHCEQALAAMREVGDLDGESLVLSTLGNLAWLRGSPEAERLLEQALALARKTGARSHESTLTAELADILRGQGRLIEARTLYDQALALARETNNPRAEGAALRGLGHLLEQQGDRTGARERHEAALALELQSGHVPAAAQMQGVLARMDCADGHPARALARIERAEALLHSHQGDPVDLLQLELVRAEVHARTGDAERARALFDRVSAAAPADRADLARELTRLRESMMK